MIEKLEFVLVGVAICFGKGRKHCGKRRKCWLTAFSPFPTMYSKGFFHRVIKSCDCVFKNLEINELILFAVWWNFLVCFYEINDTIMILIFFCIQSNRRR